MTSRRLFGPFCLAVLMGVAAAAQAEEEPSAEKTDLNPYGHMVGEMTGQPARYYVWYDEDAGWHLRTTAPKGVLAKFTGTVRVINGQFRKCRPVGLDARGTAADRWTIDESREKLVFEMKTSNSFDGFDFTITPATAELEFDLKQGDRERPGRIFIGRDGEHPAKSHFTLPATPTAVEKPPAR